VYYEAGEWPYVKSGGSKAVLLGGAAEGPYVESGLERVVAQKLIKAVEESRYGEGKVVLLRGFRGVGKSAAAVAALHALLQGGSAAVVDVDVSAEVDERALAGALAEVRQRGRAPVVFADASRLEFYSGIWKVKADVLASRLARVATAAKREGATALVVIDDTTYTYVGDSPDLSKAMSGAAEVDAGAFAVQPAYLSALVEEHSGCPKHVASDVGYAISTGFDDSHSLLAVLAARELGRSGCGAGAQEVLERAKRAAARYALDYLWYTLAGEDEATAEAHIAAFVLTLYLNEEKLRRLRIRHRRYGGIPPRGILYYTVKSAMLGAFNRAYGVGEDELCQGSDEGACKFISVAASFVKEYIPWRGSIEESIEAYIRDNAGIFLIAFLLS